MSSLSRSLVVLALSFAALSSTEARAERSDEVPNPREQGSWVIDLADVLPATDLSLLNATIDALEKENGAEIAVVTVRTTGVQDSKRYAHELFNSWGVGKEGLDNGVLVLLAKEDRRIEIEVGYGAEGVLPDGKVGDILDRHAVPSFRAGDFGGGLVATVNALALELRKDETAVAKAYRGAARRAPALFAYAFFLLPFLGIAFLIGFLIWLSRRPPRCAMCRKEMRLLSEAQENAYLDRDQEFEESIRATNWRVFRCDDDNQTTIRASSRWFSGYSSCPACGRKTASTTSHTISSASYTSTGLERVTITCRLPRCRHTGSHTRVIPRKERPTTNYSSSSGWSSSSSSGFSSSSSSSFGGGSSGGGGAGRSW